MARLMVCFVPSLNLPTALIGRVEPVATPTAVAPVCGAGVSAMDVSEAALTTSGAFPVVPPKEACICVVPAATPVATPFGVVLETVAVAGVVLVQFASRVMSCCVLSLNTPGPRRDDGKRSDGLTDSRLGLTYRIDLDARYACVGHDQ